MPANTTPIFPLTPKCQWKTLTTASTLRDGTGANLVYTAGPNGSRIDQIKVRAWGINAATVLRLFINNGSDYTVATNNSLIHETTIAATASAPNDSALPDNDITITKGTEVVVPIPYLPAQYRIYAAIGTAVAAGLQVTIHGGDY